MSKTAIRDQYVNNLRAFYAGKVDYSEGSKPHTLANMAADRALAGKMKLEGAAWESAVKQVTGWKSWTMAMLASLPDA